MLQPHKTICGGAKAGTLSWASRPLPKMARGAMCAPAAPGGPDGMLGGGGREESRNGEWAGGCGSQQQKSACLSYIFQLGLLSSDIIPAKSPVLATEATRHLVGHRAYLVGMQGECLGCWGTAPPSLVTPKGCHFQVTSTAERLGLILPQISSWKKQLSNKASANELEEWDAHTNSRLEWRNFIHIIHK